MFCLIISVFSSLRFSELRCSSSAAPSSLYTLISSEQSSLLVLLTSLLACSWWDLTSGELAWPVVLDLTASNCLCCCCCCCCCCWNWSSALRLGVECKLLLFDDLLDEEEDVVDEGEWDRVECFSLHRGDATVVVEALASPCAAIMLPSECGGECDMGDGHDSDEDEDDPAKSGDKLGVEPAPPPPPTLPLFRFVTVSIESIVFIIIIIKIVQLLHSLVLFFYLNFNSSLKKNEKSFAG